MSQTSSSYDLVPYRSLPFRQTHPNRLATVATLMGLNPPPVTNARVLELGCGRGDNLIPLGLELPGAELVGIDLSTRHVEMAAETIAELGVDNVRIEQGDILALPEGLGRFDYVIAHGVYSWLPDPARDALMAACSAHLVEDGIAYVSYNALPGWRQRGIARDALLFHNRSVSDPARRIRESQAFIEFMGRVVPETLPGYRTLWNTLLDRIDLPAARDALLYHDFLEPDNTPLYVSEFCAHAAHHGLRFVAEAKVADMSLEVLGEEVKQRLSALGDDVVTREQYRDFITNRPFRQTLLCHQSRQPRTRLDVARVRHLHVASDLKPDGDDGDPLDTSLMRFARDGIVVGLQQPIVKTALLLLGEHWPHPLHFTEVLRRARARLAGDGVAAVPASRWQAQEEALASELAQLYEADLVELDIAPPRMARAPGDRPLASPWARYQARAGGIICNLRHNGVELNELATELLPLLDGTRDRVALVRDLAVRVAERSLVLSEAGVAIESVAEREAVLERRLPEILHRLCQLSLLLDSPPGAAP